MRELKRYIRKLKNFEKNIYKVIADTVKENEAIVVEMNSEDQLFDRGVDSNNISIMSYQPYHQITMNIKKQKGQITSRVTLRDSADFHYSFYIEFKPESFEIKASDKKTAELQFKYGKQILGLTNENFIDLALSYALPALIQKLQEL